MPRILALTLGVAVAATGCAGRTWPTQAVSTTTASLAGPPRTVDIQPLEIAVWTEPGVDASPDEVRGHLEAGVLNTALAAFAQRAYAIGDVPGSAAPGAEVTSGEGADATLHVGGWAYVARKRESTASKVGKGVLIALAVVTAVVVVAAITEGLSSDHDSKSSKRKRGGANVHEDHDAAIASVRDHRGHATIRDHRDRGRGHALIRDHRGTGLVADHADHRSYRHHDHDDIDFVFVDRGDDAPAEQEEAPPRGESRLFLEMTLVDNRTQQVLWHAEQTFPANPARPADAVRAARIMLASLPASQ